MPYTYTIETSSYGYLDTDRNTIPFTEDSLCQVGRDFADTLYEFILIQEKHTKLKEIKKHERLKKKFKGAKQFSTGKMNVRDFMDIINNIKQEEIKEDSDRGSSESENEEIDEENQIQINMSILKVIEKTNNLLGFSKRETCASAPKLRKRAVMMNDKTSGSKLPKFMSKITKSNPKISKSPMIHEIHKSNKRPSLSSRPHLNTKDYSSSKVIRPVKTIKPILIDASYKTKNISQKSSRIERSPLSDYPKKFEALAIGLKNSESEYVNYKRLIYKTALEVGQSSVRHIYNIIQRENKYC